LKTEVFEDVAERDAHLDVKPCTKTNGRLLSCILVCDLHDLIVGNELDLVVANEEW